MYRYYNIAAGEPVGYKAEKVFKMEQLLVNVNTLNVARQKDHEELMGALSDVHHLIGTKDMAQPRLDIAYNRPADFSGSATEDSETWLKDYEEYIEWVEPMRPEAKRRLFSSYLVGKAKIWYVSYDMRSVADWETVKDRFLSHFDRLSPTQRDMLTTLKMQPDDNIFDFVVLASTVYRKLKLTPSDKLSRFLDAVTPRYRLEILKANPTTLEEAMRAAVDSEYAVNERGMTQAEVELWIDKKLTDMDRLAVPSVESTPQEQSDLRDRIQVFQDSIQDMFDTIQDSVDQRLELLEVDSVESSTHRKPDLARRINVIVCYNCGGENHYARDCVLNMGNSKWRHRDRDRDRRSRSFAMGSNSCNRRRNLSPCEFGNRKN